MNYKIPFILEAIRASTDFIHFYFFCAVSLWSCYRPLVCLIAALSALPLRYLSASRQGAGVAIRPVAFPFSGELGIGFNAQFCLVQAFLFCLFRGPQAAEQVQEGPDQTRGKHQEGADGDDAE